MSGKIKFKLFGDGQVPVKAHLEDAGYDCYSRVDIMVDGVTKVPLGFAMTPPDGYFGVIVPRSSIGANTRLRMAGSCGVLDPNYTGEVSAVYECKGRGAWHIKKGDRVCQMILLPLQNFDFEIVEDLEDTERGDGGFGSTGV